MKLTPTMQELLLHRIDAGVIPEVLADSEFEPPISEADAEIAQTRVETLIKSGTIDLAALSRVELEVFRDAMDGSTFFADWDDAIALGESTKSKQRTGMKAADDLEAAFKAATGERVDIPRD